MHLKYKLGISACIASVVVAQLYINQAEASGHRGNGYRPYDCRWKKEFIQQAEKALEDADAFKKLHRRGQLDDKKTRDMLGTSVLVSLLWAQDQGNYLVTKHYGGYFCHVTRSLGCSYYTANMRARKKYHHKLEREINSIRDLLGVPHPIGWEDQVVHFLHGGAQAGLLAVTGALVPGFNMVLAGTKAIHKTYQGIEWLDKNLVNPEKGLAEEETNIRKELFVRALCADEVSIRQAQEWGGFVVSSALPTDCILEDLLNVEEMIEFTLYNWHQTLNS